MVKIMGLLAAALAFSLSACATPGPSAAHEVPPAGKGIAITFDDLPYANRKAELAEVRRSTDSILRTLRRGRIKAVGFVNEDRLADTGDRNAGIAFLEQWLRAGMELGNHNYGHVGLQDTPLKEYEKAVLRGEVETRKLLGRQGRPLRYYRHPFTQTGPNPTVKTQFESFLREHGYSVAPFTIEHDDYAFSAVYDDALKKGDADEADRVRETYFKHLEKAIDAFETMSTELFGRQIPQILLIHANRLNADTLSRTLSILQKRQYRFITIEEALHDPAYTSPDGYTGPAGPSWLLRWARGLRKRTSIGGQPDPEAWLLERY